MGKQFGNLIRLYGVTYYVLSPYELRTFKGMFIPGVANTVRRFGENVLYILGPLAFGISTAICAMEKNEQLKRKNPLDYECEE